MVLELVQYDDDESSDAAEGYGVGPESPVLHLASTGTDVYFGWASWVAPGGRKETGGGGQQAEVIGW